MTESVTRNKVVHLTYEVLGQHDEILEKVDLPIAYVHGVHGDQFPAIENSLADHEIGETVDVTLTPEEGFGPHRPELCVTGELDKVPPEYHFLGAEVDFPNEQGETTSMVVTKIEDGKLTLDGNHPFAGQTLLFRLTITGIRVASADEIKNGVPGPGVPLR